MNDCYLKKRIKRHKRNRIMKHLNLLILHLVYWELKVLTVGSIRDLNITIYLFCVQPSIEISIYLRDKTMAKHLWLLSSCEEIQTNPPLTPFKVMIISKCTFMKRTRYEDIKACLITTIIRGERKVSFVFHNSKMVH